MRPNIDAVLMDQLEDRVFRLEEMVGKMHADQTALELRQDAMEAERAAEEWLLEGFGYAPPRDLN